MGLVEIVATLDAPVVLTDDLPLDGLLYGAHPMVRAAHLTPSTATAGIPRPPLPVMALDADGARVFLATVGDAHPDARFGVAEAVRRYDPVDIEQFARPRNLSLGPGKARLRRLPVLLTPQLAWYAVGSPRELRRLLNRVTHLGAERASGYGRVREWLLGYAPSDVDPARVLVRDGVAQRPIPAAWCTDAPATDAAPIAPPYWHSSRFVPGTVRAGSPCVISPPILEAVRRAAAPDAHRAHRDRHNARAGRRPRPERPGAGDPPDFNAALPAAS